MVVVPSGFRLMVKPQVWTAMRWWNEHSKIKFDSVVGPPLLRGRRWWTWQPAGGTVQPGAAQCWSRAVTARRRWGGMVSVAAPASSGRLRDAATPSRVVRRSQDASPRGPQNNAAAL